MRKIVFELCAETIDACLVAKEGGADRIELCSALSEGGLTPSHGLLSSAVAQSGLPIHVLIRPRGGDFVYSDAEVAVMRVDIEHAKLLGASGVVLGILHPDASVNLETTRSMVEIARPMEVTFHRAFDVSASLPQALEDVIASGCKRVLTSGGERDVMVGAQSLAALVAQADGRIEIAVGGSAKPSVPGTSTGRCAGRIRATPCPLQATRRMTPKLWVSTTPSMPKRFGR
jgi:copper homeostasis protein